MHKVISCYTHNDHIVLTNGMPKAISKGILVGGPFIGAIMTMLIHWCRAKECKSMLQHFNQGQVFDKANEKILATIMSAAFLFEAYKNYYLLTNQPLLSGYEPIEIDPTSLMEGANQDDHLWLSINQDLSELKVLNDIETLVELFASIVENKRSKNNPPKLITQWSLNQAKDIMHLVWKFMNFLGDYWTITGAPLQEKLSIELAVIACCWLRVYTLISASSLQLTTTRINASTEYNYPKGVLITKGIYEMKSSIDKALKIPYDQYVEKMPKELRSSLLCNVIASTMAIMLPGLMQSNSELSKSVILLLSSFQMCVPYIYCLRYEKLLNRQLIKQSNQSGSENSCIQEYVAEIMSVIGTSQAIALAYGAPKVAYGGVVLNTGVNILASICDYYKKST